MKVHTLLSLFVTASLGSVTLARPISPRDELATGGDASVDTIATRGSWGKREEDGDASVDTIATRGSWGK
ncbi:uncharacterized protein BHQ10_010377 [Talaromyces amestolkiae]|uniref:Uncharacterized protein n=1 Tax=Talaromyces amestolkiae TaxID=1196081 RepID=A0A364LEX0_TALAM|nr:uncharacterized protein BHQ10_010377 [Talaromyces amestolkiae]RAO74365.1 hypothetical protein BHQ10_010377 [Talaromyces amestolkiae]